jgi:hypothetical protein
VNGRDWSEFDREKEWVRLTNPTQKRYEMVAEY